MRKIKLTLTVTKETREKLEELSNYTGKSVSKMVEEMAAYEYKKMRRVIRKNTTKENHDVPKE